MLRWTLTYGNQFIVANEDPAGWQDITIQYIRSAKYFGIFKEVTEDLGFFCDGGGGDFLRDAFNNEGSEADVEVLVEFQCADGQSWDVVMDARAAMETYRVERLNEADIVYVKLENNDLSGRIMSRDSVPINLKSLTGLDGQPLAPYTWANSTVGLFRRLRLSSSCQNTNTQYIAQGNVDTTLRNYNGIYMPAVTPQTTDLQTIKETDEQFLFNIVPTTGINGWFLNYGDLFTDIMEFITTDVQKWPSDGSITFNVSGSIVDANGSISRAANFDFRIYAGDSLSSAGVLGTTLFSQNIGSYGPDFALHTFNFNFSGVIALNNIPSGYKIWPVLVIRDFITGSGLPGGGVNVNFIFNIDQWDFTFTSDNEYPQTDASCLVIHEAMSRTLESITGQSKAFYSTLLGRRASQPYSYSSNGCHSFIAVTNGLNVREKNEAIETSFEQMYDSIDSIGNVGIGIEPDPNGGSFSVARLEEKSYFFDSTTLLLTLTGIKDVQKRVWEEEIFNEVEIGFENWQPFAVTGLDEPLTRQNYSNIVKGVKNQLSLVCPAIMSMNLIEIIRRFGANQNQTQDLAQDESLIWVALKRSVDSQGIPNNLTVQEVNENFASVSGLFNADTAMNLRYSPKHNFLRHMNRIAASLVQLSSALWRYVSGEGNQAMVTSMIPDGCAGDFSGQILNEQGNISWNNSDIRNNTPLYEPILYNFTYPIGYTDYNTIKANPKGYIRGVCADGTVIEGFVNKVEYRLERGVADIELIKKYGS